MSELRALLFDVDGTLADTERDGHRVAFNRAFQEAGLDWDWTPELYGELLAVTGGKERMLYYLERFRPDFARPANLAAFVASLHQAKTRHYTEMLDSGAIPLRPGVARLIAEARAAGCLLGIATTTTPDNVMALLRNSLAPDAADWFDVIAAGDIVPRKKPAPDIYLWAMEQLRLAPAECVALEDSRHGLDSALQAGIRAVVVTINGYTADQDLGAAALVVDSFGEPGVPARRLGGILDLAGEVTLDTLRTLRAAVG